MTETELANLALGRFGNARIMDLQEDSTTAEHCRRMWAACRDRLLRQYPWNFATQRVVLTALAAAPLFGWGTAWQLPGDCLKVLAVNGRPAGVGDTPFEVEGQTVLSNAATCHLKYTRRVDQVSAWDSTFQDLFSWELAIDIAPSFITRTTDVQTLTAMAEPARIRAQEANASETRPRVIGYWDAPDAYTAARWGYPGINPSCERIFD